MGLRRSYDPWLCVIGLSLFVGGLIMVGSSTSFVAWRQWQDPSVLFLRRGVHTAVALLAFYLALKLPYQRLAEKRFLRISFWVCLAMLVVVFVMPAQGGAHRWLIIGPIRFQPSELAKLFAVLYVAAKLSRRPPSTVDLWKTVRSCLLFVGTLALLVLREPDLGSTAVLIGVPAAMIFYAGLHRTYIERGVALGVAGLVLALVVAPYRLRRLVEWVDYVLGKSPPVYQLDQSLIAVGSGGPTGVGLGNSMQKAFYLPAAHTDFIFSIIGEELGLIGTLGLLAAFMLIFVRGIHTTTNTRDPFGAYLALGLTCLIVGQALLHMGVCLGLLPTTGLTLPLVSYGGTSLVTSMIALGLLINVSQTCNFTSPARTFPPVKAPSKERLGPRSPHAPRRRRWIAQ